MLERQCLLHMQTALWLHWRASRAGSAAALLHAQGVCYLHPRRPQGGLVAAAAHPRYLHCTAAAASKRFVAIGFLCRERFVACPEMLETDGRQAEADFFNLEDPFWISIVDQCHFRYAQLTHMPVI